MLLIQGYKREKLTEIVSNVDTGDSQERIHEHSLSGLEGLDGDSGVFVLVLLSDERRDVALEKADADAEQDEAENVWCKSGLAGGDDGGKCRDDDEHVTDESKHDGDLDRLELAQELIGNVTT